MRRHDLGLTACAVLVAATSALAQGNPTGTLSGEVRDAQRLLLPGVVVTATSPQLQGARSAVTSRNGDYIIPLLPPGDYTVTFELPGFAPATARTAIRVAETSRIDASLALATVQEVVKVVGATETASERTGVATVHRADLIERLPTDRTLEATVLLAPGVSPTGAAGKTSIAGAMAYENLYLVNGVVVNENLRGQALPLYIEDALQETRTATSGVSAEYGRFAGGVVNVITKSGGNRASGSLRATFTNDRWRAVSPYGEPRTDRVVPTSEVTLGGPVLRDRLWFFTAGRVSRPTFSRQLPRTNVPYEYSSDERRLEAKGTWSIQSSHTIRVASQWIRHREENATSGPVMDLRALDRRSTPQSLLSAHYTGILRPDFFVEAQYSQRRYTSYSGARYTDLVNGTQLRDLSRGSMRYWSPSLCAVCAPDERDNRDLLVKGSYYRSTRAAGIHSVVFGYDVFDDRWAADNHRTGSDWTISGATAILVAGTDTIYPVFRNDGTTILTWNPILRATQGNRFRTHSLFANDQWRQGAFTFNLGLRWDKNDGRDAAGAPVVRDQAWSPRLSVAWSPPGAADWVVSAGYGRYVAGISNAIANSGSTAGVPATYAWTYTGPPVNAEPPYLTPDEALPIVFGWFDANGIAGTTPITASVPGLDTRITETLASPSHVEWTAGVSRRIGPVTMSVDVVRREARDFYSTRVDTSTGTVTDPATGEPYDLAVVENTNDVTRRYDALIIQGRYRGGARLTGGVNWTISSTYGDFDGESAGSGPMTADVHRYPEYRRQDWNSPTGHLAADSRHVVRAWIAWRVPMRPSWGVVDASLLQSVASGTPYAAAGAIDMRQYVTNPGYVTPQGGAAVAYYFGERDQFVTETSVRSDVAVSFSRAIGSRLQMFAQAHVLNVFNQFALENVNYLDKSIYTARTNARRYQPFDAFTTDPIQGVHWDYGPQFGRPTDARAYTLPRTFRLSVGLRF